MGMDTYKCPGLALLGMLWFSFTEDALARAESKDDSKLSEFTWGIRSEVVCSRWRQLYALVKSG